MRARTPNVVAKAWQRLTEPEPGRTPSVREVGRQPSEGVKWAIRTVETGRFERSLAALSALGSVVSAIEIYFEHDRASFGNRMMWLPVALGPVGLATGVAGVLSRRAARTALPLSSALVLLNGLQGTYLHARGVAQRPGGWKLTKYNIEMGPPLLAPMLMSVVGGMGLLAALLRREGS
jgi:hypothetical protein